jgi:hypothetical protein
LCFTDVDDPAAGTDWNSGNCRRVVSFETRLCVGRQDQACNSHGRRGGRQEQTLCQLTQDVILPRAGTGDVPAIEAPDNITHGAIHHAGLAGSGRQS